jgi:hypothetical protein
MNKPVELFPFEDFWFFSFLEKIFRKIKNEIIPEKMEPKNIEAKTTPTNSSVFKLIEFDFFA